MNAVLSVAIPVFAVIGAGLVAGHLKFVEARDSEALNRFVFRFAMPAALFGLTSNAAPPGLADARFASVYAFAAITVIFGSYALGRRLFLLSGQDAGAHAFASTLGNAVFLGLPIALSIEGWARPFIFLMLTEGLVIISIASAMMAAPARTTTNRQAFADILKRPFGNPLVVAMLAGLAISAIGVGLPAPVVTFFDILGRAAGPTALFSLGLFLATHPMPAFKAMAGRVSAIFIAKMFVLPALTMGGVYALGIRTPEYLGAAALFTAVPTGVGAYIMASQYKHYTTEIAAAISLTTLLSVFTISAVLAQLA